MTNNFTFRIFCSLIFISFLSFGLATHVLAAVIYVDTDANGSNDGSSWANAFANLQDALAVAQTGDTIWVAEGVYLPAAPGGSTGSSFVIANNIKLFGGFAGTETNLNQRDPGNHLTMLSGDLNGDDIAGDLDSNRTDNVTTIVLFEKTVDNAAVIDGFTIRNGHAAGNDSLFHLRRGGGIFSFGAPQIRQCRFVDNYADKGGAIYFHGPDAAGSAVDNCFFENNRAEEGGAAMLFYVDGIGTDFRDCIFKQNHSSEWGGAIRIYNSNCLAFNSQFLENTAARGGGAIETRSIVDNNETALTSCIFSQNQSRQGGAVRFQTNSGLGSHNNQLHVLDCMFESNQAIELDTAQMGGRTGGALHAVIERTTNGGTVLIESCQFRHNYSEQDASALMAELEGVDFDFQIKACEFSYNSADRSGAVHLVASEVGEGTAIVESSFFNENSASVRSGGLMIGGARSVDARFEVNRCGFLQNTAGQLGGGLVIYCRDTARIEVVVEDSEFSENNASEQGSAAYVTANNSQLDAVFSKCIFLDNYCPEGAAMSVGKWAGNGEGTGSSYLFDNCLFYENTGQSVFHCDSFPSLQFVNCAIANNFSGAILQQTEGSISMQNTILFNPGFVEYDSPAAIGSLTSLGGNLVGDGSLDAMLSTNDLAAVDPLFSGIGSFPYQLFQLSNLSPAVNYGIEPDETPSTDLAGFPRIQNGCIDAGPYESAFDEECFSSTIVKKNPDSQVALSPNPVEQLLTVRIAAERVGSSGQYRILNSLGQGAKSGKFETTSITTPISVEVSDLEPGVYQLVISVAGQVVTRNFIKI